MDWTKCVVPHVPCWNFWKMLFQGLWAGSGSKSSNYFPFMVFRTGCLDKVIHKNVLERGLAWSANCSRILQNVLFLDWWIFTQLLNKIMVHGHQPNSIVQLFNINYLYPNSNIFLSKVTLRGLSDATLFRKPNTMKLMSWWLLLWLRFDSEWMSADESI